MLRLAGIGRKAHDQAPEDGGGQGEQPLLLGQTWHHLATTPLQAGFHRLQGSVDGAVFAVVAHVKLVAVSGLQFHPVGARHQGKQGIAHVEIEQVAAPGIGHQQQAAFVQVPKIAHCQSRGALVLGQHPQFPARIEFKSIQLLFQGGALAIGEGFGQVNHRGGVIRQQLRIVVGPGRRSCPAPTSQQ